MDIKKTHIFKTTPFSGGGLFQGDTLEINDEIITMRRGTYFFKAVYSISIPRANVVNVQISQKNRGAEILVQSFTKNYIISKGYSLATARKIKLLIEG